MKKVKFLRRLKNWIKPGNTLYYDSKAYRIYYKNRIEVIESALRGECYTYLRTTGRPCNCAGCTYEKYKREARQHVDKQIWKEIYDNS